jgi:hypothetical protein
LRLSAGNICSFQFAPGHQLRPGDWHLYCTKQPIVGNKLIRRKIMATLVTGLFRSRANAERGVEDLVHYGWSRDDISLLMSDATRGREFGLAMATKAPEGAATGATIGGVLGAVAASLVALGIVAIPGLGLVAAGPILAALAGLGAGAAAGGLTGALIGLGMPEHEAKFYNEEIQQGGILVGVYTHSDRADQARKILDAAGAEQVK